jgi:uncharacterized protein (TIGR00369 family)
LSEFHNDLPGKSGNEIHHVSDLGLEPKGFDGDEYVIELPLQQRHLNIGGIVHGGVLCSLLDTAMARSFFMASGNELSAVTLEMKINFLSSAKGGKLTARAKVINRTTRTAYVEGAVTREDGRLVAKAVATMMVYSEGKPR